MHKKLRRQTLALLVAQWMLPSVFAHGDHMGFDDLLIGKAGISDQVTRIIHIEMSDEAGFVPSRFEVKKNETVRLVIANKGESRHAFMLGTARRLAEHNALLKRDPQTRQGAPYRIVLEPGATGDIVWKFTLTGSVGFACFEDGHFDAGMRGEIVVVAQASTDTFSPITSR